MRQRGSQGERKIKSSTPYGLSTLSDQRLCGRQVPRKPRLVGGVKGHNQKEISLAHILFATACPGSPAVPVPC